MRALLRLGWREAWRHKLRSALVVTLILVPVGLSTVGLILLPDTWDGNERNATQLMGDAQALVASTDPSPAWLPEAPWTTSTDGRVVDGATFTGWTPSGDGLVEPLEVEQVDATEPIVVTKFPTAAGRLPERPGEAALTRSAMRELGVGIGDAVTLAVPPAELEVVGQLVGEDCGGCRQALVAPGTVERPVAPTEADPFPPTWSSVSWSDQWYFEGFPADTFDGLLAASMVATQPGEPARPVVSVRDQMWSSSDYDEDLVRGWIVAGAAFLLLWTGLVAASGLAVGARRRKRELGLLAANGADPAALRLAVVAEGFVLGSLGAALGVAIGLAVAEVVASVIERSVWDLVQPSIPIGWLVLVWAVGTAAAVCAAWSAAVGLATLTPSQLLRGFRPTPRPAPAWFIGGGASFLAGCAALRTGQAMTRRIDGPGQTSGQFVIAIGVLAVALGLVAVVVGAARIAGRLTRAGSVSVRLAGRDLSRQGIRVAAAAAAIAMTLTGAMAMATWDRATVERRGTDESRAEFFAVGSDELLQGGPDTVGALAPVASRLVDGRVLPLVPDADTLDALRATGAEAGSLTRAPELPTLEVCDQIHTIDGNPEPEVGPCSPAMPLVADAAALELLPEGVADQLRSGGAVLPAGYGIARPTTGSPLDSATVNLDLWSTGASRSIGSDGRLVLISETTADLLGVDRSTVQGREVLVGVEGLGADERRVVRDELTDSGYDLVIGTWVPRYGAPDAASNVARLAVAGLVALVTLLIVMITLALVRVEARSDDEVLLIAGASPGLSRRVSAARAGLIVLGAAIPASLAGVVVAQALMRSAVSIPWSSVAFGLVVLPLLAAASAWLFHRPPRRLRLG